MSDLKQELLNAIDDIDFENSCENQIATLDWSDAPEILECGNVKHINTGVIYEILKMNKTTICIENREIKFYIRLSYFYNYFTRLDGTRFEKEEV